MDNRHALIVLVPTKRPSAPTRGTTPRALSPGGSAIDGRTTRYEGYARSIHARRGIETVFGLHVIAYNQIRLGNRMAKSLKHDDHSNDPGADAGTRIASDDVVKPADLPEGKN